MLTTGGKYNNHWNLKC